MMGSHDDIRLPSEVDDISHIGSRRSDMSAMTINSRYLSSRPDVAYGIPEGLSTFLSKNYGAGKSSKTSLKKATKKK